MHRRIVRAFLLVLTCTACNRPNFAEGNRLTGGSAQRGRDLVLATGCGACHVIAGVPNARGHAGPPLTGVRQRLFIAGVLPNTPGNMMLWLQNPPAIDNKTAMPDLGLTPAQARDIAAYLYAIK